jgi:hypothetical protein
MRQRSVAVLAVAIATLFATVLTGAGAGAAVMSASAGARSGSGGGQTPGSAGLLNTEIPSVSCASAGNCAAGGYYWPGGQAFVVTQRNGTWGKPARIRGLAHLATDGAAILSVSCGSAGSCSAGGWYIGAHGYTAFIADEKHGAWGSAEQVPGLARLTGTGGDYIDSVSCTAAGTCTAGGVYDEQSSVQQGLDYGLAFVVTEKHGTWGTAEPVPGLAALNDGVALIASLSCGSAGNCSAGGYYNWFKGQGQAFVVTETHGTWGTAEPVPGLPNLGGPSAINSVSCGSADTCTAGGWDFDTLGQENAFVVTETHGIWGTARTVSGLAALNTGGNAEIDSLSCGSAGNCSAGGSYTGPAGDVQAFVVTERHGAWGSAEQVPGSASLNTGGDAVIYSVSCGSAGTCSAGGSYSGADGQQAFVVNDKSGTWGDAEQVPGLAALNTGRGAGIVSVSCSSAGNCSAGGYYSAGSHSYAFVVTERHGTWGTARPLATARS